uniref:Uncharacterized protein n=1 Tax=Candidatus Desulfatibia profunda TaxID=2841695 RepID=A0A8J6TKC1_9BACT|nr:hypothetical protein [Candidatus Desulfatibia profunda]
MEPIKYTTKIQGNEIFLPDDVLKKINRDTEVEVIVRAVSFPEQSVESIDQVLERTAANMNKKYPNLNLKINSKLKAIAGISANMTAKWRKFSDKEITSMAKMEKF